MELLMRLSLFLSAFFALFSVTAKADPNIKYYGESDDFSNSTISVLEVNTMDTSQAAIFFLCNPSSGLSIQLTTKEVIFPDTLDGDTMILSVTHKFEESTQAVTTNWDMLMLEYNDAWYRGSLLEFIKEAQRSSQLNIRLNRKNKVYRFKLDGADRHLAELLDRC